MAARVQRPQALAGARGLLRGAVLKLQGRPTLRARIVEAQLRAARPSPAGVGSVSPASAGSMPPAGWRLHRERPPWLNGILRGHSLQPSKARLPHSRAGAGSDSAPGSLAPCPIALPPQVCRKAHNPRPAAPASRDSPIPTGCRRVRAAVRLPHLALKAATRLFREDRIAPHPRVAGGALEQVRVIPASSAPPWTFARPSPRSARPLGRSSAV